MKKILLLLLLVSGFACAQSFNIGTGGTFTTCTGTFYDSGGPNGNYGNYEFKTITFCPGTPGSYIQLTFTAFDLEGGLADYMTIYDGPDTSSATLAMYGSFSPLDCSGIVTASNPSGCLTITFRSDDSNSFPGWAADIGCTNIAGGIVLPSGPTNSLCSGANAFCADAGGLEFPNISNSECVSSAPGVITTNTCLYTNPNPAWYYLQIAVPGDLNLQIQQTTGPGGTGTGLDVDYAIWGPFPDTTSACADFTLGDCTADHTCTGNVIDCSYSPDAVENALIPNAQVGEVYMVLITNYNGAPGYIRMEQTNSGAPGAGATDCSIVCPTMAGTNPTGCSGADGVITVSGLLPLTPYTISYDYNLSPFSVAVTSSASGQAVISGLAAGSYTNILTDKPGCTTPSALTLLPTPIPVLNSVIGNGSICSGDAAVFNFSGTANATVTYNVNGGVSQTVLLNNAGAGIVTINSITAATTLSTSLINTPGCSNTAVLSSTVTISTVASVTLTSAPATTNQLICGSTAITPITYTVLGGSGALVSGLPPGVSIGTVAGVITISGTPTMSGTFNYSITTLGSCTSATTSGIITIYGITTIALTSATANPVVCINTILDPLTFTLAGGATGGVVTALPAGLSGDFLSGIFTISGTPTTSGIFSYTIATSGGCASTAFTGTITVNQAATATINYPGTPFCTADANIKNVILNGTGPYTGGMFSSSAGLNINTVTGAVNPALSTAGNYIVTYQSPLSGGCGITTTTTLTITAAPVAAISYPSGQFCNTDNFSYPVALSGTGSYTGGLFSAGTGLNLNPVTGAVNPALSTPGNYTVTYSTLAASGCVAVQASANITVNAKPILTATPLVQTICSGESTNIALTSNLPGTTFTWTVTGQNVSGISDANGNSISQYLETVGPNTGNAVYKVTPVSAAGCEGDPVIITIHINPLPQPILTDGVICLNPVTGDVPRTYTLNSGLDDAGYSFSWSLNGLPISGTNHSIIADQTGVYEVIATNAATGCASFPASANVTAANVAEKALISGNDTFDFYPVVTISIPVSGMFEYQADYGSFQDSNVFTGLDYGEHVIRVKDFEGCTDFTQVFSILGYPHFFTPNGDGFNDTWNIHGLPKNASATIFIFDRYGKFLKQISPEGSGWNGTFNGQELPAADYWFMIRYSDNKVSKEFRSHFSLKR